MQERVMNAENIEVHWNTETLEVLGDKTGMQLRFATTIRTKRPPFPSPVFVPSDINRTQIFSRGILDMDDQGYLKTVPEPPAPTSKVYMPPAMYRIRSIARQTAGTGCMAALEAERWLAEKGIE